jgi:type VI secretion system protein ImpM
MAMPSADSSTVAWYGKLPGTGDFASRRLDADQIETVDAWLTDIMVALRARDPESWLSAYLASPSWRFAWLPGAAPAPLSGRTWIGVVMPSVDSVGRYFPLIFLHGLEQMPALASEVEALMTWLTRLDDLAAAALAEDWVIDQLESALSALGLPEPVATRQIPPNLRQAGENGTTRLALGDSTSVAEALFGAAREEWIAAHGSNCFWYCSTEQYPATLLTTPGLHADLLAETLFGSRSG